MTKLPNAPVKALLTQSKEGVRIAADAVELANRRACNQLVEIGRLAADRAEAKGRKTILYEDVKAIIEAQELSKEEISAFLNKQAKELDKREAALEEKEARRK